MADRFVCKRCKRTYDYPKAGERPIRCECGWWYQNLGGHIKETFWERLGSYREPPASLRG
jgi:hypothetical protein